MRTLIHTIRTLLLIAITTASAWGVGYYMGESSANEQLVLLESVGLIEPFYVDSTQPALWVEVK